MDLSGENNDLLLRLMSAASLRARVLAANVANQNTPGYKRQLVRFEDALLRELERPQPQPERVAPRVVEDEEGKPDASGNTVDMEREVSAMRENRLLYELFANILAGRTRIVQLAVREGR